MWTLARQTYADSPFVALRRIDWATINGVAAVIEIFKILSFWMGDVNLPGS
jgi:hypothetical protein